MRVSDTQQESEATRRSPQFAIRPSPFARGQLTRASRILVHHTNVLLLGMTGQSHAVSAGNPPGLLGKVAERVFYPLRLMEAKYWNAKSN